MLKNFFNIDPLAIISSLLILFIALIVATFSFNYLRMDKNRYKFLSQIFLLTITLIITFSSNNVLIMALFWMISNLLLVLLMIHKSSWRQAKESGILALKNFLCGFVALVVALAILSYESGSFQISEIVKSQNISANSLMVSCSLILIASLSQSAIYPFHRWLLSSLNSPTPASALMHAGLVNGGGIILARFSPLFFKSPEIMNCAFVLGVFSAIIGTIWKLIQSNVKSMLACSTMSQMGFMIAQCAMGLFPAGIAHLFWHGMFKSYLFLSSPSAWQEKRLDLGSNFNKISFLLAVICGLFGTIIFARINQIEINSWQTTLVLVAICFIASTQVSLIIIDKFSFKKFIPALLISSFLSMIYSSSLLLIERLMPESYFNPQPLNLLHITAIVFFFGLWLGRLFLLNVNIQNNQFFQKLYVKALNASQPKNSTITSNRNQYNFH